MTKLWFEKKYPYLIAAIAGILWWQLKPGFPVDKSIISSTLSVAGIFVGFLATSKAILISMNSPIMESLKESGYIKELVSYIGQAIWSNLGFCVVNIIGYFVKTDSLYYGTIWIVICSCSFLCFVRVTTIMLKIFEYN